MLSIPQEEELEKLSVNILEDLGENNFLCEYCPSDLTVLRKLDFVIQVDEFIRENPEVLICFSAGKEMIISKVMDGRQLVLMQDPRTCSLSELQATGTHLIKCSTRAVLDQLRKDASNLMLWPLV